MWKTQDEGQGIFHILKSTEEKLLLRPATLENEVSGSKQSHASSHPNQGKSKRWLFEAGGELSTNDQEKQEAELKPTGPALVFSSRHCSRSLKEF